MNFYNNKTVWIIGGTSGIGLAIAQNLSNFSKCSVVISGRNVSKAGEINARKIPLDVVDRRSFTSAIEIILTEYKKVDIILFCVGTYEPMNIDTFNSELALNILNTNLASMVHFVENIPKLYGKCSTIGIISSTAGYFGMPNSLFYGASKAGLSHLAESLHIELKKYQINIKLISPGFVKTPLTDKNNFKMPLIISPQKAAEIIIKNFPKSKFEIAFPYIFILLLKCIKYVPFKLRAYIFQ